MLHDDGRRVLAERVTAGMSLYRADALEAGTAEPVPVRLPDGTVTTTVPVATRCRVAEPPEDVTTYVLGVHHDGKLIAIGKVVGMLPGDSFDFPVDAMFR